MEIDSAEVRIGVILGISNALGIKDTVSNSLDIREGTHLAFYKETSSFLLILSTSFPLLRHCGEVSLIGIFAWVSCSVIFTCRLKLEALLKWKELI